MLKASYFRYLTPLSLAALVIGVILGIAAHRGVVELGPVVWVEDLASVWIAVLKIAALPLMLAFIAHAILSRPAAVSGKIGGLAFLTHAGLLVLFAIGSVSMTIAAINFLQGREDWLSLPESSVFPERSSDSTWLSATAEFASNNPISSLVDDHVVTALVITAVLSLIATRLKSDTRLSLAAGIAAVARVAGGVISGLILLMPLVVLAFSFLFSESLGIGVAGVVLTFLIVILIILTLLLIVLILVMRYGGGIPFKTLIPGLAPVLLMAISTRSSLACMPVSLEVARERFRVSETVYEVVIPLSAAAFKLNKIVSSPARMLFLAFVYDVSVGPFDIALFATVAGLQSFGTPGLPSASAFRMLPLYVALGIPAEGYLLLHVVDSIPDLLKTAMNATEDLNLAVLVERFTRSKPTST